MNFKNMSFCVRVVNGPNLNVLGKREPKVYGFTTLPELEKRLIKQADLYRIDLNFFQSNSEGLIIDYLQSLKGFVDGLIINPAGYSHTSIAIRDALVFLNCPIIEVHISNIYCREQFRHTSLISEVCTGVITGLGTEVYSLALSYFNSLK